MTLKVLLKQQKEYFQIDTKNTISIVRSLLNTINSQHLKNVLKLPVLSIVIT